MNRAIEEHGGVGVLLRLAEERGMPVTEVLRGTGLSPFAPQAGVPIPADLEVRVATNLVSRFGREAGLGIEAARRAGLPPAGPWGLAVLGSRTPREIVTALGFRPGAAAIRVRTGERWARIAVDVAAAAPPVRAFLAERHLAELPCTGRALFGQVMPLRQVTFRHPRPGSNERHRRVFGVEPIFGADADALVVDRAYLDAALPHPLDRARVRGEEHCRDLLERTGARTGIAGEVRDRLLRDPTRLPEQPAVAAALYLSPRTLSRRLHEEGVSFRTLLDEVRQVVAHELLAHTPMTTEQLARHLGYAEPASFIRAFRRWKGCTPQQYRGRLAAAPPVPVRVLRAPNGLPGGVRH